MLHSTLEAAILLSSLYSYLPNFSHKRDFLHLHSKTFVFEKKNFYYSLLDASDILSVSEKFNSHALRKRRLYLTHACHLTHAIYSFHNFTHRKTLAEFFFIDNNNNYGLWNRISTLTEYLSNQIQKQKLCCQIFRLSRDFQPLTIQIQIRILEKIVILSLL